MKQFIYVVKDGYLYAIEVSEYIARFLESKGLVKYDQAVDDGGYHLLKDTARWFWMRWQAQWGQS